jgi:hypothetical protein
MPDALIPFRDNPDLDRSVVELLYRVRSAYHHRAQELVSILGPGLPSAALNLAIYFEASCRDLTLVRGAGTPATAHTRDRYTNAFLVSLELLARYLERSASSAKIEVNETALRAVAPLLELSYEIHILRDFAYRLGDRRVLAKADGNRLVFEDPDGLTAGVVIQTAEELESILSEMNISNKSPRASNPYGTEEFFENNSTSKAGPEDFRRLLAASSSTLDQANSAYRRDFIKEQYRHSDTYIAEIKAKTQMFDRITRNARPEVPNDATISNASWAELFRLWSFQFAVCQVHFAIGLAGFLAEEDGIVPPSSIVSLPGAFGNRTVDVAVNRLTDLVSSTSRNTLRDVAVEVLGADRKVARDLIDRMVCPLTATALARPDKIYSGFVEMTSSRLIVIPSLGMYTADLDTLFRFVEGVDSKAFFGVVSQAMGDSPKRFGALFAGKPDLKIVTERPLRKRGADLVDIDLGVYDPRSNLAICFEFKSGRVQEVRLLKTFEEAIKKATDQLTLIEEFLSADDGTQIKKIFALPPDSPQPRLYRVIVTRRAYARGRYAGIPVVTHVALAKLLRAADGNISRLVELIEDRDIRADVQRRYPVETGTFLIGQYAWEAPGHPVR